MVFNTDPDKVLSSENIEQVVENPTYLQEQKNNIYAKYGVNDLQSDADTAYQGMMDFDQGSDEMYQNNKQRKVSVNKASGIWREVADQRSLERAGMARTSDVINKNLNTAIGQAMNEYSTVEQAYNTNMNFMMQYPDADIDIDDSMNTVRKKVAKWESKQERNDLDEQYISMFGEKPPKGWSKGETREAIAQAGYDEKQRELAEKASKGGASPNLQMVERNGKTYFVDKKTGDIFESDLPVEQEEEDLKYFNYEGSTYYTKGGVTYDAMTHSPVEYEEEEEGGWWDKLKSKWSF